MAQNILGIIPARYASTRFPGKPLALIHGKPMIQHVHVQALKCSLLRRVIIATDDQRIYDAVKDFGGEVILTSKNHQSGTDRCSEVVKVIQEEYDVVINIQGDEPFIKPEQIDLLCSCFKSDSVQIATLVKRILTEAELSNVNVVKVVMAENGRALYFSRSVIPYQRNVSKNLRVFDGKFYKHIGLYGYRKDILQKIAELPINDLEKAESLEQLRWLANGFQIQTAITEAETISIDTMEDLSTGENFFRRNN
ncbi:MAG: 3-deoxy-manno-octulosonate cytidylyltransferase [Chitinophagales bacterium]